MWAAYRNTLEILGTDGRIEVPSAFVSPQDAGSNFFVIGKDGKREVEVPIVNQYALQADSFASVVLDGAASPFGGQDAVANMRALDACLKSAESRSRVIIGEEA
jgi:predicted dehydrogenase